MEQQKSTGNAAFVSARRHEVELAKLRSENDWLRKQLKAYQDLTNNMLHELRAIERGLVIREEARMLAVGKRVTNG